MTSGVRLGSPAGTTRGFGQAEFAAIGHLIADIVDGLGAGSVDPDISDRVKAEVAKLTEAFPIY